MHSLANLILLIIIYLKNANIKLMRVAWTCLWNPNKKGIGSCVICILKKIEASPNKCLLGKIYVKIMEHYIFYCYTKWFYVGHWWWRIVQPEHEKIFPYWWHEINFFQNEVCKQQKIQIQTQIQIHCESTSKVKITAPIRNMWVLLKMHNARTTIVEAPTSSFSLVYVLSKMRCDKKKSIKKNMYLGDEWGITLFTFALTIWLSKAIHFFYIT